MQTINFNTKQGFLIEAVKRTFSSKIHIFIAVITATIFWIIFNSFDQLLFFSPVLAFCVPSDTVLDFILSTLTAGILGVVTSMNIYVIRLQRHSLPGKKRTHNTATNTTSLFSGSTLGILSTACASCTSSLGMVLVSIFGSGFGATVSTFLTNYQTPLRIITIVILLWSYYSISKSLSSNICCNITNKNKKEQ